MKSHTSLVAQQTRLSEWADLIRDCQNRPQGMKIDEWFYHAIPFPPSALPDFYSTMRLSDYLPFI